jgi:nucleotide-binding universal stress UspA family protein
MSVAPPYWYPLDPGVPMVVDMEKVREQLQARLKKTFAKEFEGFDVERLVEIGEAAEELVRYAHNQKVDLIMMSSHGYGPFRSLLLGSVTKKCCTTLAALCGLPRMWKRRLTRNT